jgi:hypothetical protein
MTMQIAIAALILIVIATYIPHLVASRRFRAKALALADQLLKSPASLDVSSTLPPLVRSFAQRAGVSEGQALHLATFTQTGRFRGARGGRFMPFFAREIAAIGSPGFLWEARMRSGPLTFRVIDALVAAKGMLEVRLLGSFPVAQTSDPETSLAEAYRYLAELPWMPDAIAGNPQLVWHMAGENTVDVYLETKSGRAAVQFSFDAAGDIVAMRAQGRPARDSQNRPVRYDWQGRFWDYAQIGPRRVPRQGEVGYVYPSGYEAYFQCQITGYEISEKPSAAQMA